MSQSSGSWPWQWEPQSWHCPSASSSNPGHTGQRWHPNPNNFAEVRLRQAMDQKWEREKRRRQKRRQEKGHGKGQDDPLPPGDDPAPEQNKDNKENKQKEPPLFKPKPKPKLPMPVKPKAEVPQCKPEPKKMPVDRQVQPKVAKTEPEENMKKDKKCEGQAASDTWEDLWREGEKWAEEETQKMQEAEKWAEEETLQWLNERYAFWVDCMEWADEETKIWLAQNLSPNGMEQNMVRNTYSVRLSPAFICDQRLMRGQFKQSIHCSMINQSSFVEGLCGALFCSQSTIASQGGPPARASQSNT